MEFSETQQRIYDWLVKLQLPVYAEAYKGAVRLLQEKSSGYGTFVSHTGRDIMNFLARTVAGIRSGRVQYEQIVDNLEKKWSDEGDSEVPNSVQRVGHKYFISNDLYKYIKDLIEQHKEGRRRSHESGELFLDMFLGTPERDKDAIRRKWKDINSFFVKCAHLREEDFAGEVLAKIADNFRALEELLHTAAELEYSRIRTLDKILEETNNSRSMLKSKKNSQVVNRLAERAVALAESDTNRQYFFSRLKNPLWIQPLAERGCFDSPPNMSVLPDGNIQYPFWGELEYLRNVCEEAPEEVVQIVRRLSAVDNPKVYANILDIALKLDGVVFAKLKPKMLEYASLEHQFFPFQYPKLLAHWTAACQTEAALELANILVQFVPDPRAEEKQKQERQLNVDGISTVEDEFASMMTILRPLPRFNENYRDILEEGVRPLAEKEPYKVARILIDATSNMIRLGMHQDDLESGESSDYSDIWCPRLNDSGNEILDAEVSLVHTLTFASEKAYEQAPNATGALDRILRSQRWDVFKRLRQHLYSKYPSEQTRPWIRELILTNRDFGKSEHHYEFQRMIRLACEHFREELLTEDERRQIFDAILCGPPEEDFREWMGEQFTETEFERRKKHFHRQQLRPFARVLFGKYLDDFKRLEADESAEEITDASYAPDKESKGGRLKIRSPRSIEDLADISDEDLLEYINEWDDKHWDRDDGLTEINIEALSGAFQKVFEDSVIPNTARLNFWIGNRDNILRPIYVRAMVDAMKDHVKARNFDELEQWFPFCEWVLSHPDSENEERVRIGRLGDGSREHPNWHTSRRAVCDFIETCIAEDVDVPLSARENLAGLLEMLCTQYDWRLESHSPVILNRDDQLTEAINTTRGRALENLFKFGYWVRRHDDEAEISELKEIIGKRVSSEAEYPLTLPEYAVLGMRFGSLFQLDEQWAVSHQSQMFLQNDLPAWREAFGTYLKCNHPNIAMFEVFRGEFEFALEHLDFLKQKEWTGGNSAGEYLGQHLFCFYLGDVYPLKGERSLLNRFYQKSTDEIAHWARLFRHIGLRFRNTGKQLQPELKDRIAAFFEWRLDVGEPTELKEFVFWLEAECIDGEWRLSAYSRILDLFQKVNWVQWKDQTARLPSQAMHSIAKMIPAFTAGAIECLAKLIESMPTTGIYYIPTDDAKAILNAARDHDDRTVRKKADETRENMLKRGFLSVKD